jgi:hypothetical protein
LQAHAVKEAQSVSKSQHHIRKEPSPVTYRPHLLATLLLALLTGACPSTAMARERHKPVEKEQVDTQSTPGTPSIYASEYKELLNRNLFSRNQLKRHFEPMREVSQDHETANEMARTREKAKELESKGESDIVLMGIVEKDGVASAFLEDRKAGKPLAAKTGDTLAGGKVGSISVDAMEFIVGEKTVKITLGSNLQGGVSSARPLDSSAGSPPSTDGKSASDAKGGAGGSDDPNLSIIEKLRRKRQKELNR